MNNVKVNTQGDATPYSSMGELKGAYSALLKRLRDGKGQVSGFVPEVKEFIRRGRATGALVEDERERWEAQRSLDYWATLLYSAGNEPPESVLEPFREDKAEAQLTLSEESCPYRGLDAFNEAQQKDFFGRQNLIERLAGRLERERFLAILGPSGSGKSSLVLAGLVPALKRGIISQSQQWHYFAKPLVPGSDPLANLARHLSQHDGSPAGAGDLRAEMFLEDDGCLLRALDEFGPQPAVLVVDQFEEVFTLCEDDAARRAFIANLLRVVEAPASARRLILTMRIDYEPFAARLPEFYQHFAPAQERVPPLEASELRDAIELPAKRVGLIFEDGVVNNLIQDILGEPAALPLLQFTLLKLWEHRRYNRVTLESYFRLGGGRLALARSADKLYDDMTPQNQKTLQRVLLRLVRPGVGLEVVRNRVRRVALLQSADAPERVELVLDKLIGARLVRLTAGETPEDDQVEVAHEALIRNWPRLVEWLDNERVAMETRRNFEAKAAEWMRLGRGTSGLLDAEQLEEVTRWLRSEDAKRLGYDEALPALVEASRRVIKEAERQQEEAVEREREQLRQLAQEQAERANQKARAARYLTWAVVTLGVLLIAVAVGAYASLSLYKKAEDEQAKRAQILTESQNAELAAAKRERDLAEENTRIAEEARKKAEEAEQTIQTEKKRAEDETLKTKEANRKLQVAFDTERRLRKEREEADRRAREAAEKAIKAQSDSLRVKERNQATDELAAALRKPGQVRPGASVGSVNDQFNSTGSICCIVQDKAGIKYLLSFPFVFSGEPGSAIVQPGGMDGGDVKNKVAEFARRGADEYKSGALAKILPGVNYSLEFPGIGRINGVAASVHVGERVRMIGRCSGLSEGAVLSINEAGEIITSLAPCGGDSGAPVVTSDGRLVGMLWGSSAESSIVTPIRRVLQELDVQLVP